MKKSNFWRKCEMTHNAIKKFIIQLFKNYSTMKATMQKIWLLIMPAIMWACGSTKVVVDKPAAGTQTTITVTTNNPITTDVNPNVELKNTK